MKKFFVTLLILLGVSSYVMAEESIAIVDLQQIVSSSTQVKQLKQEHAKKMDELNRIITNARGEIANEKDPAKVLLLEDKYTKEFNTKKESIDRDYNNKLSAIEKNIKNEINKIAEKKEYDYVFAKSVVLYGGKDITQDVINNIK